MALVNYSDSEGSEDEKAQPKPVSKPTQSNSSANFAIDKSNPRKIRVNLGDSKPSNTDNGDEEEPAAKRPRVGGGGFSGFNAMLPAPKRDAENKAKNGTTKLSTRKVFSLKTGAEPGFSRESDAELRQFFAEQDATVGKDSTSKDDADAEIPEIPKSTSSLSKPTEPATKGNSFMFKPLSVARNPKKKKFGNGPPKSDAVGSKSTSERALPRSGEFSSSTTGAPLPMKKVSLFSSGQQDPVQNIKYLPEEDDVKDEEIQDEEAYATYASTIEMNSMSDNKSQSLDSIATDLNLSAADRRQLFGRGGKAGTAINVVNFNTDQEYAHNEELRAAGETVQHNPVRAIAPGKHSLKQLVNAASGQKEALEESFAAGRRNKKEAGNKYGW